MSTLALSIVLGVALAVATGFRVFLPMLIVSGAAYTGHLHLDDGFAWLGTPSVLIMLSVAALAEVLAYYIPVVDNLLDTLATPAAFVAGTIVSSAVMIDAPPRVKWTAAVIAGGGRRRIHARVDRGSQGTLDRFDRRPWQFRYRHGGARRRRPDTFLGACGSARRHRAGGAFLIGGDTSASPAISGRQVVDRPDVAAPPLALLAVARRLRRAAYSPAIIDNPVRRLTLDP